jgi:lipid-A-disaccharide synthase
MMQAPQVSTGSKAQGGVAGCDGTSVFLSAGEASGDRVGALLVEALKRRRDDLRLAGIGGRLMAAAGVKLVADSSDWAAIGVFEATSRLPRAWAALRAARRELEIARPAGLVLIDCGSFNVPLARAARRIGIPTLYYFPPGSWSRRPRGLELRNLVDCIATPFPWSRDLLTGGQARVEWVGHPVMEAVRPQVAAEAAYARYGLAPDRPVVALVPGSRSQEIQYVLPVIAEGAALLAQDWAGAQFVVPVARSVERERVADQLDRAKVSALLLEGMDYDALQLARAAVVCSGTATLELTCLGVPMVVVYRASRATTLQYRLFRGLLGGQQFAAMPNILAGREIVRELLGSAATPEAIASETAALLSDQERRGRVLAGLEQAAASLGPPGASERTAELLLTLVAAGERLRDSVA